LRLDKTALAISFALLIARPAFAKVNFNQSAISFRAAAAETFRVKLSFHPAQRSLHFIDSCKKRAYAASETMPANAAAISVAFAKARVTGRF
jgi:hypothetical protein